MTKSTIVLALVVTVLASGCAANIGRAFPSPDPGLITVGKTDKTFLLRTFGEPYQVGLDSGSQTWKWFYGEGIRSQNSKEFNVIFNPDGTVKSYSFLSNFPQDMARMK